MYICAECNKVITDSEHKFVNKKAPKQTRLTTEMSKVVGLGGKTSSKTSLIHSEHNLLEVG